jgi:hypothetical protein
MRLLLVTTLLLSLWLSPALPNVRGVDAQQRAQAMASLFNKTKHKVKEKRGFRLEVYVEVRSQPAVRRNAAEYAGTYEAWSEYPFHLQVGAGGRIEAGGTEPGPRGTRQFTLRDAKIEGALLTATKVYADGQTEKFEAVFINRTVRNSQTDNGTATFGLGVVYDPPKIDSEHGFTLDKLFYELK